MYTVYIADDEGKVISGLINRVHWDALDASVIGYAKDGSEAAERIAELNPDIVITDILMPGQTGLQLMDRLKETCDAVFIIFSAYSEFEYAREKGNRNLILNPLGKILAVSDYLGKPLQLFPAYVLGPSPLKIIGQVDQRHSDAGITVQKRGYISLPALIIQAAVLQTPDHFRGRKEQFNRIAAQRVGGYALLFGLGISAVKPNSRGPGGKTQPIFNRLKCNPVKVS